MDRLKQFFDAVDAAAAAELATSAGGSVTMRTVSPVRFSDSVLIFTQSDSRKYKQLQQNPNCCIGVGTFFAEAAAQFCGSTMLEGNAELRAAYNAKYPGAFDEGMEFGGRNADFVLLRPKRLTGWAFAGDPALTNGIPTEPFAQDIN